MKFTNAYLLLSTLIGTTAAATLRGSDEDSIAPPRVFDAQQQRVMESSLSSSSRGSLSSSKWTHHREDDEAAAAVSSISHGGGSSKRTLQCASNQLLRITLSPDAHSNDDNEFIVSIQERDGNWRFLDEKRGTYDGEFTLCLSPGHHKFEAIDSYSDGILNGGSYQVSLGGSVIFRTPSGEWHRTVHKFDVEGSTTSTAGGERVEEEPEFLLLMRQGGTAIPTSVAGGNTAPNPAPPTRKPTKQPTPQPQPQPQPSPNNPPPSPPSSEPEGDEELVNNQDQQNTNSDPAPAPASGSVSTGTMTAREREWLDEHNKRRQQYHTQKGVSYRPLKWSKYLKDSAQTWAEECARTGVFDHAWHQNIGENMARHTSSNGNRDVSNILTRWVENEMNDPYPDCGHMTQALWRATEYVGCGEASKGNTYYQVCQYSKPGNCQVNRYNYWTSVLADDSSCNGMPLLY